MTRAGLEPATYGLKVGSARLLNGLVNLANPFSLHI
jgi:hypothetical protein